MTVRIFYLSKPIEQADFERLYHQVVSIGRFIKASVANISDRKQNAISVHFMGGESTLVPAERLLSFVSGFLTGINV
jgi:hypothetical protein